MIGADNYVDEETLYKSFYHELSMSHDHQYIVTLKGYCPRLKALVYELMEGGSLLEFITSE